MTLREDLRSLLADASSNASPEHDETLRGLSRKLDGPLHVALAGRIKAGKSTLLNALIGERLAPTDAGECTRIVTWYEHASEYSVSAEADGGRRHELSFHRASDGQLVIDLGGLQPEAVVRLVVGWPSVWLRTMTLIDTPGLDSLSADGAARTMRALAGDRGRRREADAVLYLMRHAHRSDIAFLEAFQGTGTGRGTPVNSIAVLSRADEIGAARLDALESARRIAQRYAADTRLQSLAATVVSVAGLLAETAGTLEEHEADALRVLAREDASTAESLLLSADHFRQPGLGPLTIEIREGLLDRLGLFGVRFALQTFHAGHWMSATELARLLSAHSGLPALREAIEGRFAARSRQLVNRSVLLELSGLSEAGALGVPVVRRLEQLESGAHEFAELAMLDLVLSGGVGFSPAERKEAERVTGPGSPTTRVGSDQGSNATDVRAAAIAGVARWRERAADPLSTRATVLCAETMAHCYEELHATAAG